MIMKCSLKDIFINILFFIIIIIIIISPSEGVEFPLFLPRGSVISDSMNLQQLRASINRLQDLDSFPVSSENQLHKIVKKQMTNCDYHKRKNKRSIAVVPERLKSFDVMNKGDGFTKSLPEKPENLKSKDSISIPAYEMCLSKLAQMARNSGIRFYPSDRTKNDEYMVATQKRVPPEPGEETPLNPLTPPPPPPPKDEKLEGFKEEDIPEKEKNPDALTQEVLDNIKAIMNSDLYAKANENKIKDIAKMMKDDEYQQVEDLNLQWPCMTVEDKIKEYLLEDQLPEIKLQAGETEEKLKENEAKNKLQKGPEDKGEVKEPKEKKDSVTEDKKKDQKNDKQVEKADGKNLEDVKTWENMSEKEMAKVTKDQEDKKKKEEEEMQQNNPNLKSKFRRIPDENDFRYYYECEARPNGCLKLRHKRCPQGQFFSFKFLKCLKAENKQDITKSINAKNKVNILKRHTSLDSCSGGSEPANEWLDTSQDSTTVVPPEFQSTTEPGLKIYHLRPKRKFKETTAREMAENVEPDIGYRPEILNEAPKIIENPEVPYDGIFRKHRKHHAPRSYVIRIKKKEGKDQITESNENEMDNDEDDQDSEDDDEDEEVEDEEEENDEEDMSDTTAKTEGSGQGLRDLFKAAKTAVTNRARFEDPTLTIAMNAGNKMSQNASKKEPAESENQNKKVLIDANIKVDSTIGSVLKSLMKTKGKDSVNNFTTGDEESLISDRGSQDQLDPELLRMYEHLMRSNPRVKRYFLANRYKKGK